MLSIYVAFSDKSVRRIYILRTLSIVIQDKISSHREGRTLDDEVFHYEIEPDEEIQLHEL